MSISRWDATAFTHFIFIFWCFCLAVELLLIGHYQDWLQALAFVSFPLIIGLSFFQNSLMWIRFISTYSIILGFGGIIIHLKNNLDFELEMYPELSGWPLFLKASTGALPVLAPGSMIPIGLLGFLLIRLKHNT